MRIFPEQLNRTFTQIIQIASFLALISLFAASSAFADSIDLTVNTSALINISSPDDNFWGEYINVPGQPVDVLHAEAEGVASVPVPDVSVSVPYGNVITSAFVAVSLPSGPFQGTGYEFPETVEQFPKDPSLPSVAPTFSTDGTSDIEINGIQVSLIPALINGNEVSINTQNPLLIEALTFGYEGPINSSIEDPGFNWAGYVGGQGQVNIPYTVQLSVTYSPVPEPSSIALFGTGLVGLAGLAYRKIPLKRRVYLHRV